MGGLAVAFERSRGQNAWLLVALMILCSSPPTAGRADEFAEAHRQEIREMVAASVKIETGLTAIQDEFAKRAAQEPDSPSIRSEGALDRECRRFIHARFYAKFRMLIDDIDPHPFTSIFDIGESNSDNGILRDPRKIAIETRYIISNFRRLKDFHPPAEEFAVQYAARPDLDARCSHDLDITGMKN